VVEYWDPRLALNGRGVALVPVTSGEQWPHYTWTAEMLGDGKGVRITSCSHPDPTVRRRGGALNTSDWVALVICVTCVSSV
jgi:hypothetical protein